MNSGNIIKKAVKYLWSNKINAAMIAIIAVSATIAVVTTAQVKHNISAGSDSSASTYNASSAAVDKSSAASSFVTTAKKKTSKKSSTTKKTIETTSAEPKTKFPVDINLVTYEQLLCISGVGTVTAQQIIDLRSQIGIIYNMDQLLQIDGIGEKKLNMLKRYLYVSNNDYQELKEKTVEPPATTSAEIGEQMPQDDHSEATTTAAKCSQMCKVNINTADVQELCECLLIDEELAEEIVRLREKIHVFSNALELLYADGMSEQMLSEIKDYIVL